MHCACAILLSVACSNPPYFATLSQKLQYLKKKKVTEHKKRLSETFLIRIHRDMIIYIHSLIFSLEGRAWQEPEFSHVTGMALAHCILGKFLGVVCHCFPPSLDVPTLAAKCLCPQ